MTEIKPGIGYVDSAITAAILPTLPCWHAICATPNVLTTLGLFSSGACVYSLYHRSPRWTVLFLALRCYFDYADGLLARKYNQTSEIGDWYDHIVDVSFSIGLFGVVIFSKYPARTKATLVGILVVFFILFLIQMGCIEREFHKKYNKTKETSISRLRVLCPAAPTGVAIIQAFDNGTLYLVIVAVIVVFCHRTNNSN